MAILTTIISVKLKVSRKLTIATPSAELVDAYLTEIAKAYNVNWSSPCATDSDGGPDGGAKVSNQSLVLSLLLTCHALRIQESTEDKAGGSESLPGANPSDPSVPLAGGRRTPKLPDIPPTEDEAEGKGKLTTTAKSFTPPPVYKAPPEDDFEALTRRFEALKKR